MPRSFYIKESELDDYQVLVLQKKADKPVVVKGCAGSGKSLIALHRVKQIQKKNVGTFYFILFTNTLKQYMKDGIHELELDSSRVVNYDEWKVLPQKKADFIIVDEVQDFSEDIIMQFQSSALKALSLFGDSAQQIYSFRLAKPLSMEDIASITSIPSNELSFNHRLPKKIARFAELISDSDDILADRCRNEGNELPKILEFNNLIEQLDKIIEIVNNRQLDDVGILFQLNKDVKKAKEYFDFKNFQVEAKFNNNMDLDFSNQLPKLTTYHSSKGLQFESVFIPDCENLFDDNKNALYVAITRSYQSLFIMHSGALSKFFDNIPSNLFETSLVSNTSLRL